MYHYRRRSSRLRLMVRAVVALALVGTLTLGAAIGTNALGAKDRFDRLVERVDRLFNPPPDIAIEDQTVTARPTPLPDPTVAPTELAPPTPTLAPNATPPPATPTPGPTPMPAREPVDVDLLAESGVDPARVFASQVENDMCAPAGVQMALAVMGLADTSDAFQQELHSRVREWESFQDSQNGNWGPFAMQRALAAYGADDYRVRVYETREDALFDAAFAIRTLGKPVILLTWRGAHTWVMTGYHADADPTRFPDAHVSGAYILDPWYPRVSSIWGPSDPPGTFQDEAEMVRNYLAWERPEGRYGGRDGRWVAVVPTTPAGG